MEDTPGTAAPSPLTYVINGAALTTGELYRLTPNPAVFLFHATMMGLMRLMRVSVPLSTLPGRISFEEPFALAPDLDTRVQRLCDEFAALGFEHLTSFSIPQLGGGTLTHVAVSPDRQTYGAANYTSLGRVICPDALTCFGNGASLTTVVHKSGLALRTYPEKLRRYAGDVSVEGLWEDHRRSVAELAPQHGAVAPVGEEELLAYLQEDFRRSVEYQIGRGVLVPGT